MAQAQRKARGLTWLGGSEMAAIERDPRYAKTWWGVFKNMEKLERPFIDITTLNLLPVFLIVALLGFVIRICSWAVFYPPPSEIHYPASLIVLRSLGLALWFLFLVMTLINGWRAIRSNGTAHTIGHNHIFWLKAFLISCLVIEFAVSQKAMGVLG
jgi:hypothetical protein